jgi:Xaa-Pro aminopeptidase
LRGTDIKYNPLFKSYLLINDNNECTLYINPVKINEGVAKYLSENNVTVKPINEIFNEKFSKVAIVANEFNYRVALLIEDQIKIKESPIEILKAVKNEREV